MKCLKEEPRNRPCMIEVGSDLRGLIDATNGAMQSTQQGVDDSSRVDSISQFDLQGLIDATNGATQSTQQAGDDSSRDNSISQFEIRENATTSSMYITTIEFFGRSVEF
ncbi:unnamed protein product [Cuscuta epithymum]|nr:unnamed protein product [Cuscuta epithymum]